MLQRRGGPVGGAVGDRRTRIAEQIEHRAGVGLRASKSSVLIWPLSVYTSPPLTLSEFTATGVRLLQVAESLITRLAAPLGAGVVGSMAKQVLGSVQPVVPCEKSPFTSRLELNDHPTSGAVKPPSTTA